MEPSTDRNLPSRVGKSWTEDEENRLIDAIGRKTTINDIAKDFERTTGGITSRLNVIASKMYNSGSSIEEIILKTGLNSEQIKWAVTRRQVSAKPTKVYTPKEEAIYIMNQISRLQTKLKDVLDKLN